MAPLTPRQSAFVAEYLVDLNGTQAAIRAGYSPGAAAVPAHRLITNAKISVALTEARAKREAGTAVNAAWVLERLRENVERAMQAQPVYDREGVETGEYTYQGAVANRALELLGKHHGLFSERLEHTGAHGGSITITVTHTIVDPHA
jgi:phage terminase small subunit